jgi:imidazolonepropionase
MAKSVLVRGARQLLTLNGPPGPRRGSSLRNIGLIEDGSLLIVNGVIASVGPTRRVENLAEARTAIEIDASGHVVMPAFVDSNTHLLDNLYRGIAASDGAEGKRMSVRRLGSEARRILTGCVRHGSGTVDAHSGCGTDETTELRMLRAAASLDQQPANVVATYAIPSARPDQPVDGTTYLDWLDQQLLPRIQSKRLAQFVGISCGSDRLSLSETQRLIEVCQRHGLMVRLQVEDRHFGEAIPLAISMDVVAVEGLRHVTSDHAAALAGSPVLATLLPANALLGRGDEAPPARSMIDAGVAVALASGFRYQRKSTFNMQMVIALACSALGMTAAEAISAATINGACALQMGDRVGSLQFGKDADLLILNVADYREISWYFGVNLVSLSMRRGDVVYRESQVQWPAA